MGRPWEEEGKNPHPSRVVPRIAGTPKWPGGETGSLYIAASTRRSRVGFLTRYGLLETSSGSLVLINQTIDTGANASPAANNGRRYWNLADSPILRRPFLTIMRDWK